MSIGFKIKEKMSGHDNTGQKFEFNVTWGTSDIKKRLKRQIKALFPPRPDLTDEEAGPLVFSLEGDVTFKGGTYPCSGHLVIDYFDTHTITYIFKFRRKVLGGQYNEYEYSAYEDLLYEDLLYVGEKVNIKPWNLLTSHTTCFGTVTREKNDELIARTLTFFKFRTVPKFLTSIRLKRF